jgi:hypothetical protein
MTLIDDRIKEIKAMSAHVSSRLEAGGTRSVDPKEYLLLVSQYIELCDTGRRNCSGNNHRNYGGLSKCF